MNQEAKSINLFGEDYGHEYYEAFESADEIKFVSDAFAASGAVVSGCGDRFGSGSIHVMDSEERGGVDISISELLGEDEYGPNFSHLGSISLPPWLAIKFATEVLKQAQKAMDYNQIQFEQQERDEEF